MPASVMAPDILPGSHDVYQAFLECSSDRQVGVSTGPIPFTTIDRYAYRYGFDSPEQFAFLHRILRVMDAEYMRLQAKQIKQANS